MESLVLKRKKTIIKNKEEILDLTSSSVSYPIEDPLIVDSFFCGDDMCMRPDLASYAAYGVSDYFDVICKFNGISNPFALDRDTYMLIPDLKYMDSVIINNDNKNIAEDIRSQYIDVSKESNIDPKRLEFEKTLEELRKNSRGVNFSDYSLPPNLAEPGAREGNINDNGTIILGNDI